MKSPEDPLDRTTMEQLRDIGDDAFVAELAEMFLADFEPAYAELMQAIAADDRVTAVAKAHFLKGSSLSIGLHSLSALLAEVEHHFREETTPCASATVAKLQLLAAEARNRVRDLVPNPTLNAQ